MIENFSNILKIRSSYYVPEFLKFKIKIKFPTFVYTRNF